MNTAIRNQYIVSLVYNLDINYNTYGHRFLPQVLGYENHEAADEVLQSITVPPPEMWSDRIN